MQITGQIVNISQPIKIGQKQTEKQTVKIEQVWDMEEYKRNSMVIDFFGKQIPQLIKYKVGDIVTVEYNCRTSVYNDKTYNNISGRAIALSGEQTTTQRFDKAQDDWDLPF